jgi:ribonuclease P/MRP protein subunit RPP40
MYVNTCSVMNKFDYLCATVSSLHPDIIGIAESWASDKVMDAELMIAGYDMFRCDRPLGIKGGGVILYIKNKLKAVKIELCNSFPEQVWCEISIGGNESVVVGVCYRTPTETVYGQENHSKLRELLVEAERKNFMLMGDFNYKDINWSSNMCSGTASDESRRFLECVQELFLTQHVYVKTTEKSVLDLVISKEPELVNEVVDLGKFSSSDHNLLWWTINIGYKEEVKEIEKYDYKRMDIKGIQKELSKVEWDLELEGSVNESWVKFKSILQDLQGRFTPVIKLDTVTKSKKEIWLTYKAMKCIRKKHKVYRKYKDNKHPACIVTSRLANNEVKLAKYNFEKKLAEKIKSDSKSFFAYVRSRSKAKVNVGPIVDNSGEVLSSHEQMSEAFNKYFASVFTGEKIGVSPTADQMYYGLEVDKLKDITISEEVIMGKLDKLREDKAAGADELVPRFLCKIKKDISYPLGLLFGKVVNEGQVPDDWRDANVIPIFKTGNRGNVANYRPVSLTSQLCKVFESIIRDEMVSFLDKFKLIRNSQHGFRKGRSCLSNLLSFLDIVTDSLDRGITVDVVFLDLAKAFDKVPHRGLLEKLYKHGIDGKVKKLIENWLRNRRQRVCMQGKVSTWERVLSGVPQGSVLGPLLFIIFINDLDVGVWNNILKFADDTKLFGNVENEGDRINMQGDLDSLVDWSGKWQMEFNVKKCKLMHLGGKNKRYEYKMGEINLEKVEVERDLGVVVTSDLKCSEQCGYVYNKASKILGMLNRTIKYKETKIMLNLYKTLVRPHLEYCVSAWSPHYSKDKHVLERVQHRFTRMIKEVRELTYEQRLKRLKLWTLEERRNRGDLIEVFKMYKGFTDMKIEDLFKVYSNDRGTRGHTARLQKVRSNREIYISLNLAIFAACNFHFTIVLMSAEVKLRLL